jgi:hypothetical protein
MKRAVLIALALALTAARSDGISGNAVGADVFGGIARNGTPPPPPTCTPGAPTGQLDFSVCSNIIYVPALIH